MSQTPDQPNAPESASPPTTPIEPPPQVTPSPQTTPTAQPTYAAQAQSAPSAPGPTPRRSMWGEATSTRGGTLAVVLAAAGIGLVALLLAGLAAVFVAREVRDDGDDRAGGPWAGESREMPGPQGMNPGRGPGQLPPGQEKKGAGDLPGLGMMGNGGPLHGEAVVPGDGTATRTVVFQRGEVTAVTADKLTVKSTDGYSATYTIGADTRQRLQDKVSTLAVGDEVTVIAAKEGNETLRILRTGRAGSGG